eukprot:maker-scaffold146_size311726-snap-gene-1.20 protein:Tk07044 transcript:maker-scaffold146_size311726-snap-gene-1.20-mRNA-1 annotation:"epithelial chloride channel"
MSSQLSPVEDRASLVAWLVKNGQSEKIESVHSIFSDGCLVRRFNSPNDWLCSNMSEPRMNSAIGWILPTQHSALGNVALTEASRSLYVQLNGKIHFSSVNVQVPMGWTASDCQTPLEATKPVNTNSGDIYVSPDHPLYNDEPWTQQSLGCGQPGDFIYLPRSCIDVQKIPHNKTVISAKSISKIARNQSLKLGEKIRDQWIRYRFGVFADLPKSSAHSGPNPPNMNVEQHSLCFGKSVRDIVFSHPDLISSRAGPGRAGKQASQPLLPAPPQFVFSRSDGPKFVIALENSEAMNENAHWDMIRRACKKFILYDAPPESSVALVLFNQGAHIAHALARLDHRETRQGLAVQIKNKYSLSPRNSSCVRCGIVRALEALESASHSSAMGANVIVISQGLSSNLGLEDENEVMDLAAQHRLRISSIAIPKLPQVDISLPLERVAHKTGGLSYFIPETASDQSHLATYVHLVDAFREIQARSTMDGPFLIYEKSLPSISGSESEESGSFVIDKYVGRDTQFNVFATNREEGFLKSISVIDRRGQQYRGIHDTLAAFRTLSVYKVPFELDENIGMNWKYSLERIPSFQDDNQHIVRVTSRSRMQDEDIKIMFFTNMDLHAIQVGPANPIKLFAEVKLNGVPVIDARAIAHIQGLNHRGELTPVISVQLFDRGHGDPDLKRDDGIYSRYLTDLSGGEARYSVTLVVDDNDGRAFSFQRASSASLDESNLSCCQDGRSKIRNQKLGSFQRIVKGDSFRISKLSMGSFPPARILDLQVDVLADSQQLEFLWTAPGNNLDQGKTSLYQLYSSENPNIFYTNLNQSIQVDGFSAIKKAGERESHKIVVDKFNTNVYYAIISIGRDGHAGEVSNIRETFMPSPASLMVTTADGLSQLSGDRPSHRAVPSSKSEKVLLFIIVGVVSFIILCLILVLIIVFSYRRKKAALPEMDGTMRSMGVSTAEGSALTPGAYAANSTSIVASSSLDNLQSPGYSVCDEHDLIKEQAETNRFLHSYSDMTVSNGTGTQNSVSFADETNPYAGFNSTMNRSATYGWTEYNNPYVVQSTNNTLPTYRDFQNHQQQQPEASANNGYLPNYYNANITAPPTYAKPIPKHQRISNIYANPTQPPTQIGSTSLLNQLHQRSQQSPAGSIESAGRPFLQPHQTSEDERVPSISPPLDGVSVPLISSSNSNTPTKSILKKPKHYTSHATPKSQEPPPKYAEDGCSQSSSGKEERGSESSNVSFSDDRDTPNDMIHSPMVGPLAPIPPLAQAEDDMSGGSNPDFSPSNTYLETSFEAITCPESESRKVAPPTLPKPKVGTDVEEDPPQGLSSSLASVDPDQSNANTTTLDRKIRNITQV